jgi:Flp pilus assembly pilin Flp
MQLNDAKQSRAVRPWASLGRDRSGASAIEYSLIAALIGLAIVVAASFLGVNVHDMFMMFGTLDAWNAQP